MNISALLTSAGINIGIICLLLLSFYSILRKQPGNAYVYFGRQLAEECKRAWDSFILESFVPSPSYIVEALQYTEEEILSIAGLDAVVFNGIMVFRTSMRWITQMNALEKWKKFTKNWLQHIASSHQVARAYLYQMVKAKIIVNLAAKVSQKIQEKFIHIQHLLNSQSLGSGKLSQHLAC